MAAKSEFTVAQTYHYDCTDAKRWIGSHLARYAFLLAGFVFLVMLTNICSALIPTLAGVAFTLIVQRTIGSLGLIALALFGIALAQFLLELGASILTQLLSKRVARDARNELYSNLLGKSQTFHNRQRVGDIMARATGDLGQLSAMISPAGDTIFTSFSNLVVTLIFIACIQWQLLLIPLLYTVLLFFALRDYSHRLLPSIMEMRSEMGEMDAVLNEALSGIETIKATSQEEQEIAKFSFHSSRYRTSFIENGKVEGWYFPILIYGVMLVLALLQGLFLVMHHQMAIGQLIAFMGLMMNLRSLTSMSFWTFGMVQQGIAGAKRVLALMGEESELDANEQGYHQPMQGEITFEHVSFGYGEKMILDDISFHVCPGQTVAIVGQIGSGKTTLTKLINRIYDVQAGRVLIDGIDVASWQLDALRGQIATIEQDVFLFSRTIEENIAYGLPRGEHHRSIEDAARAAQADTFIRRLPDGYQTVIGERGVTLSGGQRQRIAIARALLTDPRLLILDDATSAIDSATEDEIQQALTQVQQGRTTVLITHRLAQIRRADLVLVLDQGKLIAQGTHDELLKSCSLYQMLFAHQRGPSVLAIAQ